MVGVGMHCTICIDLLTHLLPYHGQRAWDVSEQPEDSPRNVWTTALGVQAQRMLRIIGMCNQRVLQCCPFRAIVVNVHASTWKHIIESLNTVFLVGSGRAGAGIPPPHKRDLVGRGGWAPSWRLHGRTSAEEICSQTSRPTMPTYTRGRWQERGGPQDYRIMVIGRTPQRPLKNM